MVEVAIVTLAEVLVADAVDVVNVVCFGNINLAIVNELL